MTDRSRRLAVGFSLIPPRIALHALGTARGHGGTPDLSRATFPAGYVSAADGRDSAEPRDNATQGGE